MTGDIGGVASLVAGLEPCDGRWRCIGPGGEEYVRMGDHWEVRQEAEKPLSDERLIALVRERWREFDALCIELNGRGYLIELYSAKDRPGKTAIAREEIYKKV